jgi:transcription-repair coupling factor (superfamily II helicase)
VQEAIGEIKGEPVEEKLEPTIRWGADALFPDEWVGDADEKLVLYRRLSETDSLAAVDEMRDELEDRFGPAPPPARGLFLLQSVKVAAARAGVEEVREAPDAVRLRFASGRSPSPATIKDLLETCEIPMEFYAAGGFEIVLKPPAGADGGDADPERGGLGAALEVLIRLAAPDSLEQVVPRADA